MDNNINTLNELNKGCSMGIVALNYIIPKINEDKFRDLLEKQTIEYKDLSTRISKLYEEYTSNEIAETTIMEKVMSWYGINKDMAFDNSISKVADLLIQGTNMGIIEGRKLLNNKTMDKKIKKICKEYIKMQEAYLEKLKEYL